MLAFPLFCPKTRFCLSLPLALLKKRNEKRKVTFENEKNTSLTPFVWSTLHENAKNLRSRSPFHQFSYPSKVIILVING